MNNLANTELTAVAPEQNRELTARLEQLYYGFVPAHQRLRNETARLDTEFRALGDSPDALERKTQIDRQIIGSLARTMMQTMQQAIETCVWGVHTLYQPVSEGKSVFLPLDPKQNEQADGVFYSEQFSHPLVPLSQAAMHITARADRAVAISLNELAHNLLPFNSTISPPSDTPARYPAVLERYNAMVEILNKFGPVIDYRRSQLPDDHQPEPYANPDSGPKLGSRESLAASEATRPGERQTGTNEKRFNHRKFRPSYWVN